MGMAMVASKEQTCADTRTEGSLSLCFSFIYLLVDQIGWNNLAINAVTSARVIDAHHFRLGTYLKGFYPPPAISEYMRQAQTPREPLSRRPA